MLESYNDFIQSRKRFTILQNPSVSTSHSLGSCYKFVVITAVLAVITANLQLMKVAGGCQNV